MTKQDYKAKKIAEAKECLCVRDNSMMTGEPFCRLNCNKEDVFDFLSQTIDELYADKERILNEIQKDLDYGKFNQICSNENTFKEYIEKRLHSRGGEDKRFIN